MLEQLNQQSLVLRNNDVLNFPVDFVVPIHRVLNKNEVGGVVIQVLQERGLRLVFDFDDASQNFLGLLEKNQPNNSDCDTRVCDDH